jgi:hypothetical protein
MSINEAPGALALLADLPPNTGRPPHRTHGSGDMTPSTRPLPPADCRTSITARAAPFLHDDPIDRPARVFAGTSTIYTRPAHPSHLLLPIVPG